MEIVNFGGFEMEKEMKTSFQDYFNESYLDIIEHGRKRRFTIVYLRFFEDNMEDYTLFTGNPICTINGRGYNLREVFALIYFFKHPEKRSRKRIYISDGEVFSESLKDVRKELVEELIIHALKGQFPKHFRRVQ